MMRIASSGISRVAEDSSSSSASVSSTVLSRLPSCLVFLPRVAKLDTVSHPVTAWNIGSARAFSRPNPAAISCAARYRKLWPVPNASHSLSSGCNRCARDTASTTTSVSALWISIAWCLWLREMHAATSDCPLLQCLLSTASPSVMTSCLSSWSNHSMTAAERNLNSSVLLLSCPLAGRSASFLVWLRQPLHVSTCLFPALHVYYLSANQQGKYPRSDPGMTLFAASWAYMG